MAAGPFAGKWVAITGAGSGIGRATALRFARAGARLALADLRDEALPAVAAQARALGAPEVRHQHVDVSSSESVAAWAAALRDQGLPAVDVLINNAGVGLSGGILDTTLDDWKWVMSINVFGVIHGCHHFAPAMVARGQGGHIVNIASLAGLWASPQLGAYATSKFAVVGYSEALREELRPHRIAVTTICPGIVATSIVDNSRVRGHAAGADDFKQKANKLYQQRQYTPEKVAESIFAATLGRKSTVPVAPEAWLGWFVKRVAGDVGARLLSTLSKAASAREGL